MNKLEQQGKQLINKSERNDDMSSKRVAEETGDRLKNIDIELPSPEPHIPEPAHTRDDLDVDRYPKSKKRSGFIREPTWEELYPS